MAKRNVEQSVKIKFLHHFRQSSFRSIY